MCSSSPLLSQRRGISVERRCRECPGSGAGAIDWKAESAVEYLKQQGDFQFDRRIGGGGTFGGHHVFVFAAPESAQGY
ncbi:UNVERIFIED_CONTAM: hypothetical protein FKN15_019656 [Acipenser sinensis]